MLRSGRESEPEHDKRLWDLKAEIERIAAALAVVGDSNLKVENRKCGNRPTLRADLPSGFR
jgi:hypothetical protein